MEFSKVRNSERFIKILPAIIIFLFLNSVSIAQVIQQFPSNYPQQGYPQNFPNQGTTYPQTPIGRDAQINQTGTLNKTTNRTTDLTLEEQEDMTHEDSVKAYNDALETEDLALMSYRKRIFGYKLFNDSKLDINSAINISTPNNYVLGSNDHLIIDIYGYSQFQQEVVVSTDGYITLSRAGLVKVGGLAIEDAKLKIKQAFSNVFVGLKSGNTFINVSLGNVRGIKVNITGEVIAPGTYTVTSFTSLLNALYICSGPNEIGTYRQIKLIRNNKVVTVLDVYDILINGSSANNILLHDQDIIQVGTFASRIAISGNTKREGLFEMLPMENLEKALTYAGGFDQNAYTDKVKIYRNTSKEKKILDVKFDEFQNFIMQTGDSVVVNEVLERFENMVKLEGAVFRPGEYSLDNSPTLLSLINSADGFRGDALLGRINILRTTADLTIQNISVNGKEIINGNIEDFKLEREDQIIVSSIFDLTEVSTIKVSGAINNEDAADGIELPYVKKMTLEDALVKVGGITEAASLSRIEIVRRKRNVDPTQTNAQISDIILVEISKDLEISIGESKIELMPYDEIFVRSSPNYQEQSIVELQGEVFYPSQYGINNKEERISDIIKRAGGLTPQAYIPGATLIRTVTLSPIELEQKKKTFQDLQKSTVNNQLLELEEVEETTTSSIGIKLDKIINNPGGDEDMILRDGDILKIPSRLETVRVQGEVLYPNTVKFKGNESFKNYISGAGGFTNTSLRKKSYVLYANGSVDRTRKFLFFNLYPVVEPGSEIIVPARKVNTQQQITQLQGIVSTLSATVTGIVTLFGIIKLTK